MVDERRMRGYLEIYGALVKERNFVTSSSNAAFAGASNNEARNGMRIRIWNYNAKRLFLESSDRGM